MHCSRAILSLLKNGADLHTVTELTWKKYYTNVICTDRYTELMSVKLLSKWHNRMKYCHTVCTLKGRLTISTLGRKMNDRIVT